MADYTLSARITADDTLFQKKMSSVQGKLESVSKKFSSVGSGLEKVGDKLTSAITKPATIATSALSGITLVKGFDRLVGIDNAKAKLKGLGHDAKTVEEIMNSATISVKGTAFGLDEAATTAANAVAAGIKPGKELTKYLNMTADAAAIAGVSMAEMGSILNKVQTGQTVYTEDLEQLADRGLPVYQWLADEAGIAASEVKQLASEGGISSKMLYSAIEKNIGGAAKIIGENSFSASLANIGASLSRIGANFLDAGGKGGGFFSQLKPLMSEFNSYLSTFEVKASELGVKFGESFANVVNKVKEIITWFNSLTPAMQSVVGKAAAFGTVFIVSIGPILSILGKVFSFIGSATGAFGALSTKIAAVGGLKAALAGVFTAITGPVAIAIAAITAIIGVITYLMKTNESFRNSVMSVINSVMTSVQSVLSALMPILSNIANTVGSVIVSTLQKLAPVISKIISIIGGFITSAAPIITNFLNTIAPKIQTIISAIAKVAMTVTSALMPIIQTIISIIGSTVIPIILKILTIATSVIGGIISVVTPIISFISTVITNIITVVSSVISAVSTIFNTVKSIITTVWNGIKTVIGGAINLIISVIKKVISPVTSTFNKVKTIITNVFNKIKSSWSGLTGVVSGVFNSISGAVSNVVGKIKGVINNVIGKVNTAIGVINDIGSIVGISLSTIPYLKRGTDNWQGGFAYMNEAGRGELTYLPNGSQVIPHDLSVKYAKESARLNNNTSSFDVYTLGEYIVSAVSNQGSQIANSLERGVGNIRMVTDNREVARMVSNLGFRRG